MKERTASALVQRGLSEEWWNEATECEWPLNIFDAVARKHKGIPNAVQCSIFKKSCEHVEQTEGRRAITTIWCLKVIHGLLPQCGEEDGLVICGRADSISDIHNKDSNHLTYTVTKIKESIIARAMNDL